MTVEMSYLMPMILFLILGCILALFYYHDKNLISGAAYETAVVGSTKAREKEGVKAGELETLFAQRIRGKCILFVAPSASVSVGEEVRVAVSASHGAMRLSVEKAAAVTEPEKHIRDRRKIGL